MSGDYQEKYKEMLRNINDFLSEIRKSEEGYAKITNEDINQLYQITQSLIELKCEKDYDGDYPIEVILVNKLRERILWPPTIPHENNKNNDLLRHIAGSLNSTASALDIAIKKINFKLED